MRDILIVDVDGVLVDSTYASLRAYRRACAELGVSFDELAYLENFGLAWPAMSAKLFPRTAGLLRAQIHERKKRIYDVADEVPQACLIDKVKEQMLTRPLRLLLATGTTRPLAPYAELLKPCEVAYVFSGINKRAENWLPRALEQWGWSGRAPVDIDVQDERRCIVLDDDFTALRYAERAGACALHPMMLRGRSLYDFIQ